MRPSLVVALLLLAPVATRAQTSPAASAPASQPSAKPSAKPTAAEAKAFVAKVNTDLKRLWIRSSTAEWIKSTHITDDTERNAAALNEDVMAYLSASIRDAVRFDGVDADPDTKRMLMLLKIASPLPAPSDPAKRAELAALAARLEGIYGKGKYCPPVAANAKKGAQAANVHTASAGAAGETTCSDLQALEETLAKSRDYDVLLDAWIGWHGISREMRPLYERYVALGNEGAREIGFRDLGELWRAGYDMTPAEFEQDTDRLWNEVKPLYDQLHCYVRARLTKQYGAQKVPPGKPIPAHLLGNMWAQDWANLYPILEPYKNQPSLDVDAALKRQAWTPTKMVKTGEAFFTSLGLEPLPATFWERSQFTKPRDREVVCHASAWDVTFSSDLRIKMCIRPTEEDLVTIHHELGHNYYQRAYVNLPVLFQNGANDGFHEAIGDAIALAITPGYLKSLGLIREVPKDQRGVVNVQMKRALEKISFLPFGKLIDQWRWDVFSGKVAPASYNATWWDLRRKYQGVDAPVARSETDFDPGAKYHIPANVPYTRYFLAHIYQFQFYKALCDAAGHRGPLHECSFLGSKEAGKKLDAMLQIGASKPWPEAFEAVTGTRQADASALLEYFAPLRAYLEKENAGQQCGW
jgi:peptidyl-dipeptidase A